MDNKKILSQFYNLCGEILSGKAKEEDIQRITKAMVDSNQQDIMKEEFEQIGVILVDKK